MDLTQNIVEWTQYRYHTDLTGLSDHDITFPPGGGYVLTLGVKDYDRDNDSHYLKAVYDNAALERIVAYSSTDAITTINDVLKQADNYPNTGSDPEIIKAMATELVNHIISRGVRQNPAKFLQSIIQAYGHNSVQKSDCCHSLNQA